MRILLALLPLASGFALQEQPWFSLPFECEGSLSYAYTFFDHVQDAKPQLHSTYKEQLFALNLGVTAPETINWELEWAVAKTPRHGVGYRTFAFQARYLWLDDCQGDAVSWATGLTLRNVSAGSLHDLSNPFPARGCFELTNAIGKEWIHGCNWGQRFFGFLGVGQGTQGSPWLRTDFFYYAAYQERHELRAYCLSYFGFGSHHIVHLEHFNGWSKIAHRSIDGGIGYRFCFPCWGSLSVDYIRRLYARSYPSRSNCFLLSYELPFSVF